MNSHLRASKRRRRKPNHFIATQGLEDDRLLQTALANSRVDIERPRRSSPSMVLPVAPTFYPTLEEFCDGSPIDYINKIRPVAEKYGICKIVPPAGWDPPFCVDMTSDKTIETKRQKLNRLQEGRSFDDGEDYTPRQYQEYAKALSLSWKAAHYDSPANNEDSDTAYNDTDVSEGVQSSPKEIVTRNADRFLEMTHENLEKDYWDIVETQFCSMSVEYGNDVDTNEFRSGFPYSSRGRSLGGPTVADPTSQDTQADPRASSVVTQDPDPHSTPQFATPDFYKETYWNLNNIPSAPGSILRHVKAKINGINVPWLYFGCLFSTFCWHNEDNYLYSINYHHRGAPKQWYGVPGTKKDADALERVFRSYLALKMKQVPDLLHHITTMISPRLLQNGNVPVFKLLQHPGEFIVTFPRAFHGGFSLGPNIGEAVNFATPDWIIHGADANERYRQFSRPAVFSHDRLAFTLANHVHELSFHCCESLVHELRRITDEEIRLRSKLLDMGVRDVSDQIQLPRNRLDQLDEQSADYDDKRLCCHCKHVCFFSAVACECSHSRVSCLRHSHLMCKCRNEQMYLMIWCSEIEMTRTLEKVETVCATLKRNELVKLKQGKTENAIQQHESGTTQDGHVDTTLPLIAPGAIRDWVQHAIDEKNKCFIAVPLSE